ncbi:MAG: acyltransferase [Ruminococcus sp.]|nr:acyltransferase [Ruminococcus sp.]
MNEEKISVRNSAFELLRILSMWLITFHHITNDCGLQSDNIYINIWSQFFTIGGKLGVNVFVLIGGYFLYEKKFSAFRLVKLHAQVLTYDIIALVIGIIFCREYVTPMNIMKTFFPVTFSGYWFITAYFGILILSGVLNAIIHRMTYSEHCICILTGIFLLTIIPTFTTQTPYNSNLGWFIILYFIGAYFRKYETKLKKFFSNGWIVIVTWFLIFLSSIVMLWLGKRIGFFNEGINFFSGMYILTQLIQSISLFLFFEKKQITSKFLTKSAKLGKYTLACYLIQSNCILVHYRGNFNRWLWTDKTALLFPFGIILITVAYCLLAMFIDCLRVKIENVLNIKKIYLKTGNFIDNHLKALASLIHIS